MGVLISRETGKREVLVDRCVAGRSVRCTVRVDHEAVSGEHAVLTWRGGEWGVRDLGSTNGTFVNGVRVEPGFRVRVSAGDELRLGGEEGRVFLVEDASAPGPSAYDPASGARVRADGVLGLPTIEPEVTIFEGDEGAWLCERDTESLPVRSGQIVHAGGAAWVLELPERGRPGDQTTARSGARCLEAMQMRIAVSLDEEYVAIEFQDGHRRTPLKPRTFHYMLLVMARARLADEERGLPASERGWLYVDQLAEDLGVTRQKLNLDVFRVREQLASAGIEGGGRVIQRRTTSGQVRLGIASLEVLKPQRA